MNEPPLVLGMPKHPANSGRLCSKGSALAQTVHSDPARLDTPIIDGQKTDWDEASAVIAQRIQDSIAEHGKESVAFYLSGQLLTEDYYVANKFMKGYVGTANVDTNSRLCMSSAVAAYKRAFGADAVPCCYEDLDAAELILLIGSNAAWTHPVLYQRMQAAKERNPQLRVVLIDPRKTASCDLADMQLQLQPSSDGFLFQGLLDYLIKNKEIDQSYIDQYTDGFGSASELASEYDLATTAAMTGLSEAQLAEFFALFAKTEKVISFYSQGINQSASGSDKCNAIINCHLASGKIGYAGAGPFSITGQPNAMGGREVGGLANMLAAHMDFAPDDVARVQRFWNSPEIASKPGLKAVDLFEAVYKGDIKVLWIMATNPAVSLPDSDFVRKALQRCETVIVSDVTQTDTTEYADILLPALSWGEKDGSVTNSERCISRQRPFKLGVGLSKPDWWAVAEVAKKMGFADAFNYQTSRDVFVEHAALSGYENTPDNKRCFDISALAELSQQEYDRFKPTQWPINASAPNGTKRLLTDGQFFTESGKAQFLTSSPRLATALQTSAESDDVFMLNTGRLRDQWHTMTRTGNAPSLTLHDANPFVQIHSDDAKLRAIEQGSFIELSNQNGNAILQVEVTDAVSRGQLFAPIHWNDQSTVSGVVNRLMPQVTDPVSGQPESKSAAVQIRKFEAAHWAKIVAPQPLAYQSLFSYWATHKCDGAHVTLIASDAPIDCRALITELSNDEHSENRSFTQFANPLSDSELNVLTESDKPKALGIVSQSAVQLPSSVWLADALQNGSQLNSVLRGEQGEPDSLICACFGTLRKTIEEQCEQQAKSHSELSAELSQKLGCGSKCGSCKPEINELIRQSLRH